MKWSVGLTTMPERRDTTLPCTLTSLCATGWDEARLFVDGVEDDPVYYDCDATFRQPQIGAWANWCLGLTELHLREPNADAYLMCQDDVVFSKNVRQYIEKRWHQRAGIMHGNGWLNLYTVSENEQVIADKQLGTWHKSAEWNPGRQVGRGALALAFSNQCVEALLSHPSVVTKCRSGRPTTGIDGTVTDALNALGWREWVSNPSLCDHIGGNCSIIDRQVNELVQNHKRASIRGELPKCQSFKGVEFDCLNLL